MKLKLAYFLFFCFVLTASAQIDTGGQSISIPAEKEDNTLIINPEPSTPEEVVPEVKIPETPSPKKEDELPEAKRKPFSILKDDNTFRDNAEVYQDQLDKALVMNHENERKKYGSLRPQFLGEFYTKAKRVNIIYRDHQYPDGDLIRVYVNDVVQQPRVLLESRFKGFYLELKEGANKIDFQALNQGSSGPNTAEFQVLDEKGFLISTNQWNLATGVKATIFVVKEKEGQ